MSARQDIGRLLDQWLQLTKAEAAAIQAAAWSKLAQIQSDKAALQQALDAERQRYIQPRGVVESPAVQAQVARLVSLEARNAELLAAQQLRARAEQSALEQSKRTLRKVRRSYNQPGTTSAWEGYS
jgi:hypothetical protein